MYVCMYVCMYVHMCVCMYVYVCMHVCTYVCMYVCCRMYVCMYVCMCMCTMALKKQTLYLALSWSTPMQYDLATPTSTHMHVHEVNTLFYT